MSHRTLTRVGRSLLHLLMLEQEMYALKDTRGERRVVIVVQGPHGYVSPTLYGAGPYVPTWNFVTVHLHGTPEILGPEETYRALSDTVDHFEAEGGFKLAEVAEYAHKLVPAVTAFRLVPDRVVGKAKLSQDKPAEIVERVINGLEDPALVAAMRAVHAAIVTERGEESQHYRDRDGWTPSSPSVSYSSDHVASAR